MWVGGGRRDGVGSVASSVELMRGYVTEICGICRVEAY